MFRTPPHGHDVQSDIKRLLPAARFSVILDVGANIGQSAIPLAEAHPAATVHCFEPSKSNYERLAKAAARFERIKPHNVGAGDVEATKHLAIAERSTRHHILDTESHATPTETVQVITIDGFCEENSIGHVDYLKIDTEGYDLNVLLGARNLLLDNRIDFVQVEAGFGPKNTTHAPYSIIAQQLEQLGYFPFGFYEQKHEWREGKLNLRRSDVVFVSGELANRSPIAQGPENSHATSSTP